MYSRFTRRSKRNISKEVYLHQDEITSLQDSELEMQNQQYPPTFTPTSKEASMLYSMLPTIVQSRLPRIPSIRSSVNLYGLVSGRKSEEIVSGATTPGSIFSSSATTLIGARSSVSIDEESTDSYFTEESLLSDEDFPQATKNRQLKMIELSETKSGIGWKFASQGYSLLTLSMKESSAISQNTRFSNTSLARQLYIHALTYLLRALPSDLSTEESMSLQTSIPQEVVESIQEESSIRESSQTSDAGNAPPSLLQRSVAATIIQLFILLQFILPYVKYLLTSAYQYDRTYKISEKVLSRGIVTVDTIGKSGLAVTGAIYGMGDGKVGQALTDAAAWVVEGVTGGVHEGVSGGLVMLGAKNGTSNKKMKD
ncbi:hypothetical protein sscle_04g039060 [Sclerotinia sclerotiorum 1980 UF-70]|uniref:Uncharacterized protein n=2 Tax=Sclerotinia sclerotiorum (strain ATCC 18683 / 1980 / Ss-1) TaxID=665079 RepID=A0A1D9Q2L8_SCLS1|nr:hypothetical protein sscle_04g039060 [Sclerotinia sclerotiorum 1980 UF-70]